MDGGDASVLFLAAWPGSVLLQAGAVSTACSGKRRVHICLHVNNEETCNYITAVPWDTPFTCV